MTDELKCLAHPCDGVMETNLYDASLTCSKCQFQVADESEYAALVAGRQAAIDDETQNPWKAAIIQELIVDNILTEELERDPRTALAVAIDWNCKVALDPSVSAEARALQQAAIDAALENIEGALNADGRYDSADFVRLYKGSNPLAERAAEYARGIEFRVGQLAERDRRIAELEQQVNTLNKTACVDVESQIDDKARIAELESLLAEAYADADDVLRPQIEELEHMLSEEPHNIPTKYVQHGGVTFALHGSSSIQAYEELERELAEARKDAGRYEAKLFALGAMEEPPCFKCGYNGPGYFQTATHPCAHNHHNAMLAEREKE